MNRKKLMSETQNKRRRQKEMKNKHAIKKILILSLFTLSLIGCTTTNTHWGDWNNWGRFEQTGSSESQRISINSKPEGSQVFVDGNLRGETPTTINLNYPVLRSERTKSQYQQTNPGVLEHFLTGSRGTTSPISTQKEDRFTTGTRNYTIEIRKEGYLPRRTTITIPETTNLELTLKEKPVFAMKKLSVKNNFYLTVPERVFEFLYGKKYSIDPSKFDSIKRQGFTSEAFDNPLGKNPDYYLEGEIDIQRGTTEITVTLTDRLGRQITTRRTNTETRNPDSLPGKVEGLIKSIIDTYLQ
jgi:hypothetical protein